ncbi:MAG: MarR family winged helix-turn-helix transcriptional regulator [Acidimicrobiales bacterium]
MARATDVNELAEHPNLTAVGLLVEVHAGLAASLGPSLEADHGLPGQRFEVLLRLVRSPGERLRMTDLAAQTTLSASGLTRVVDRLVDEGLVERAACPSDRRGAYAVLTAAGRTRVLTAVPDHLEQITSILAQALSPHEIETLSALLRRLRDVVHPDATRHTDTDC